jgi:hypothetical protein
MRREKVKRENKPSLPSDRNEAFEKEIQRSDSVRRETATTITTKHQRKNKAGKKQRQTRSVERERSARGSLFQRSRVPNA